jgi:hypothetical protein
LFHLIFESHDGRAFVPIPKRSASPRATSKPQRWDSLKVLDPEWPIREADIWLLLWRSSGEILNHGCKSLRSDFHRAGERMIDDHNGQQPGKDQD